MTRQIEQYAAQVATRVGQQEAALHGHPLQAKIDRVLGKRTTMRHGGTGSAPQVDPRHLAGLGAIHPAEAHLFKQMPIDRCATGNCRGTSLGSGLEGERPWWFWLAVGAGVGGLAYVVLNSSGMRRNPDDDPAATDSVVAARAAAIAVQAGIPTILWGAPGIGKTSWLVALGKAMNAQVFTVIGSTKEPTDIGGMPKLDGSRVAPKWAQDIRNRSLAGLKTVLFLDEFSSMSPMVHAALLRVVRDKIAGDCDLDPKNAPLKGHAVHVVCAANPKSQGAASKDLPPPAANRMLHIEWPTPSARDWAVGIMLGFPLPKLDSLPDGWRETLEVRTAKKDMAAFLAFYNKVLDMPKGTDKQGRAWPSPRSLEMAAEALGAARVVGAPVQIQAMLLEGSIGLTMQSAFFQWYNGDVIGIRDRADVSGLLEDATTVKGWKGFAAPDKMFVLGQRLVRAVAESPTKKNWEHAWQFIDHVVTLSQVEGANFEVAPLAVMASDLLNMLDDPDLGKKLQKVQLPDENLLAALDYDNIKVRRRS